MILEDIKLICCWMSLRMDIMTGSDDRFPELCSAVFFRFRRGSVCDSSDVFDLPTRLGRQPALESLSWGSRIWSVVFEWHISRRNEIEILTRVSCLQNYETCLQQRGKEKCVSTWSLYVSLYDVIARDRINPTSSVISHACAQIYWPTENYVDIIIPHSTGSLCSVCTLSF